MRNFTIVLIVHATSAAVSGVPSDQTAPGCSRERVHVSPWFDMPPGRREGGREVAASSGCTAGAWDRCRSEDVEGKLSSVIHGLSELTIAIVPIRRKSAGAGHARVVDRHGARAARQHQAPPDRERRRTPARRASLRPHAGSRCADRRRCSSSGSVVARTRGIATGQRGWKRQPDGSDAGLGDSPPSSAPAPLGVRAPGTAATQRPRCTDGSGRRRPRWPVPARRSGRSTSPRSGRRSGPRSTGRG